MCMYVCMYVSIPKIENHNSEMLLFLSILDKVFGLYGVEYCPKLPFLQR